MKVAEEISKIKYTEWNFKIDSISYGETSTYEILPNGAVLKETFRGPKRQLVSSTRYLKCTGKDYVELRQRINECIKTATGDYDSNDNCDGTVTLLRAFGRTEMMHRGFGSSDITIGNIIKDYISKAEGLI